MPRPKGRPLPPGHKERIGRAHAENGAWIKAGRPILAAANSGDYGQATELFWDFIAERQAEMVPEAGEVLNFSATDRRHVLAEISAYADELHSETLRLQAERRTIRDAELEQFRAVLRADIRALIALSAALRREEEMDRDNPYAGIPSPADRAAAVRRIANQLQGEPLPGALPHVAQPGRAARPTTTTHGPHTGTHVHEHAAYGAPDAASGVHRHRHEHEDDADQAGTPQRFLYLSATDPAIPRSREAAPDWPGPPALEWPTRITHPQEVCDQVWQANTEVDFRS
jgi:hypothetical protein